MMRQAVAGVVTIVSGVSMLNAQGMAGDPWTQVPALPTTCDADLDFSARLTSLYAEIGDAQMKQDEVNSAIEQKFNDMPMPEKMQRMSEFMRKDPQKAMKMMQAQQGAAAAITSDVSSGDEAKKEREAEFAQLRAAFNAEMDAGAKPFRTRRDEIMKTSRRAVGEGSWEFTTRAAQDEYNSLIDKENADYEARCAAYFGANGKMHKWLASYRETALDPVARATEANDEIKTTQMTILESPGAGYRSTAQMTAVREYVLAARNAYDLRRQKLKRIER